MNRIEILKTAASRTPTDPFPRYGLAMEYRSSGQLAEAARAFAELLEQFPDYVPTYLMAGGNLVALDKKAEAAEIFRKGIEVAGRKGDAHARKELQAALDEIT